MTVFSSIKIYRIHGPHSSKSYIGSTTQSLQKRLSQHKTNGDCSSKHILQDATISLLEEILDCPIETRKDRERYWLSQYDCLNVKR